MLPEPGAEQDQSAAIAPSVKPQAPWRLVSVQPLAGYRLAILFRDGLDGVVDLNQLVASPKAGVFAALQDPEMFNRVFLEYGAVTWPGEIDLAPDVMHDEIERNGVWIVPG